MSECFTCKNKIEIQKHKHVICKIHNRTRLTVVSCNDYPDIHWKRAKEVGVSDSQLYKQAGNGVTKNVVYEIAKMF